MRLVLSVLTAATFVFSGGASSQEWTRFRGPNGSGLSDADGIPVEWTEADYNWKVKLPGVGHSQPVLWGEKVFVTTAPSGEARLVLCLRARDGSVAWTKSFSAQTHDIHLRNSFASSTPAVDEARLYVVVAHPGAVVLRAFDHDGNEKWQRDLGPIESRHGHGTSPIVHGDLVVLAQEHGEEKDSSAASFVVALDRQSGELRWKTPRRSENVAYGTPCVLSGRAGGKDLFILTSQAHGIAALDAASGAPVWEAKVFTLRTVSSPVLWADLVLATCGSGGGGNYLAAVRSGGSGDVAASHVAYTLRKSMPYVPTPLVKGDRVYLWSDKGGIVSCVEAASGKTLWQERVGGDFSGSPICVRDRLYAISERGEVVVVAAADEFRVLGRSDLGEPSRSTPAVAGGRMYLRTSSHLISIGGKGERRAASP
jgi:outer membrane protein assembly factor BamB